MILAAIVAPANMQLLAEVMVTAVANGDQSRVQHRLADPPTSSLLIFINNISGIELPFTGGGANMRPSYCLLEFVRNEVV